MVHAPLHRAICPVVPVLPDLAAVLVPEALLPAAVPLGGPPPPVPAAPAEAARVRMAHLGLPGAVACELVCASHGAFPFLPFIVDKGNVPALIDRHSLLPLALIQPRIPLHRAIYYPKSFTQSINLLPVVYALTQRLPPPAPLGPLELSPHCGGQVGLRIELVEGPLPAVRADVLGELRLAVGFVGGEGLAEGVEELVEEFLAERFFWLNRELCRLLIKCEVLKQRELATQLCGGGTRRHRGHCHRGLLPYMDFS
ncbi:hypothetical protein FGO68_gene2604 [Halteria grandinella]|uniref:Uncharacterized protein n=1 Tax=Halteria grandinella TaxID=5974 RepID=A0A8J8NCU8_HALGN|nr:hypothetical protein FGO68_gene2604 [Halteria grandinella]